MVILWGWSDGKPHDPETCFFYLKEVFIMGGPGSGSQPTDHLGSGRKKKQAISVVGTGVPAKPDDLPDDVSEAWDSIAALVEGVAFSQDGMLLEECARLWVRQQAFHRALSATPLDDELNRLSLAIGRALIAALAKLGLTPRDRQILLVARPEAEVPNPISRFFQD